jgi:hypothetical protein
LPTPAETFIAPMEEVQEVKHLEGMFTQRDNLIIFLVNIKRYNKEDVKYFLNDKNLYIEYTTPELKQILSVKLTYKIDVYESKLEFLVDYLSFTL